MDAPLNTNPNLRFVFASTNEGKLSEVNLICKKLNWDCISPSSLVTKLGPVPNISEGIESYKVNAYLKAKGFFDWCKLPIIADDTGLEVDYLKGLPGIKSARFAGEQATMRQNKDKLLLDLSNATIRTARFRSVLCLILPNSTNDYQIFYAEAVLNGAIKLTPSGSAGFGYDDLFEVEESQNATLATLKQEGFVDTHRYRSFLQLAENLKISSSI